MTDRIFRYVPLSRIPEYEAIGWQFDKRGVECHHDAYSRCGEWKGAGEPVEPATKSPGPKDRERGRKGRESAPT